MNKVATVSSRHLSYLWTSALLHVRGVAKLGHVVNRFDQVRLQGSHVGIDDGPFFLGDVADFDWIDQGILDVLPFRLVVQQTQAGIDVLHADFLPGQIDLILRHRLDGHDRRVDHDGKDVFLHDHKDHLAFLAALVGVAFVVLFELIVDAGHAIAARTSMADETVG